MRPSTRLLVGTLFAVLLAVDLPAQSISGTLTGIVSDATGAVLPKASLKLRDENSGSLRDSVTNGEGYFTFVSLPPGSYQLMSRPGFRNLQGNRYHVLGGDKINVNVA